MPDLEPFDLDAYLDRIGWQGSRRADLETLRGVHLAHALAIPFENLDSLSGQAPSLATADLLAKMVHGRRGGYCYEHNALLRLSLETLGFQVTPLAGRVVLEAQSPESRPRTHAIWQVTVAGEPQAYLADVGFGSVGALLLPVPLVTGTESEGAGRRHRLVPLPHRGPLELWELQAYDRRKRDWVGQYAFTLEPFAPRDFEVFNWYISTHPRSPFTQRPLLQRATAERHLSLDGFWLTETRADGTVAERELTDEAEVWRVAEEEFGIAVPERLTLPE
ncbi:arylamine N-acetyltransferase [Streptomyces caniferus]|uniref:Arylamine N-acetyltransferase n=1 Tax=Streptomyces caniferus TaxID=285557 RepID=A0A640S9V7_9ACTN|nr:arylamine N-acetyltransferase [Streptomyces caniferus]GFE07604.1 arylamine N-acetyltransferase [Streptomyces caniferus]